MLPPFGQELRQGWCDPSLHPTRCLCRCWMLWSATTACQPRASPSLLSLSVAPSMSRSSVNLAGRWGSELLS